MFNIVLVHPEIPPNTGNIIRLCANTGCQLHLIEPLGFNMEDKQMRRAGLDYHEYASVKRYPDWQAFLDAQQPDSQRLFAFTTKGQSSSFTPNYQLGDYLVFGAETAGLPPDVRTSLPPQQLVRLPMLPEQRSLNLSNSVAITVYEAWRQNNFAGALPFPA
jgi:tRNA (cytidine/uridine-2'-O-)-methyltransferase